jgi:23S rRNA (adenine2030-N6)-methyltransferase
MNYRHIFHAGNFADVFKHIILIAIVKSLLKKDTPFCYLDTHSGIGRYDLLSDSAQKTKEFEDGIGKVFSRTNAPSLIQEYVQCIKNMNQQDSLQFYPGSPCLVRSFLRPADRMILSELHPDDYRQLKHLFAGDKQVAIHHQDGYQSMKAFLPPKEKRGLVLIDPAYEKSDELSSLPKQLASILQQWETGIYAVWYPIKNRAAVERFHANLKQKISRPLLTAELSIYPEDVPLELSGCGMAIINPPWQLDKELETLLPWLLKVLSKDPAGKYKIIS